jgi:hypothetical protein
VPEGLRQRIADVLAQASQSPRRFV